MDEELIEIDENGKVHKRERFILSMEECRALHEWIYSGRVGYVSYEHDYTIIRFVRRLNNYLDD